MIWVVTEERPLKEIVEKYSNELTGANNKIKKIVPEKIDGKFNFVYKCIDYNDKEIQDIKIFIAEGIGSFPDYLFYKQKNKPTGKEIPDMAVEETKTSSADSRNSSVMQRATKFSILKMKGVKKYSLYYTNKENSSKPIDKMPKTYIFGIRLLITIGVKIFPTIDLEPFRTIEEIIVFKNSMQPPPTTNTPVIIQKTEEIITISIKLNKGTPDKPSYYRVSHDPNVGFLILLAKTFRELGWTKDIRAINTGLPGSTRTNSKIALAMNKIGFTVQNVKTDKPDFKDYWKQNNSGEKHVSILQEMIFEDMKVIFSNHAGTTRSNFINNDDTFQKLKKAMKVPDLILLSQDRSTIQIIEAEMSKNVRLGINQLETFEEITALINEEYPMSEIKKTVSLFGDLVQIDEYEEVDFILKEDGTIIES